MAILYSYVKLPEGIMRINEMGCDMSNRLFFIDDWDDAWMMGQMWHDDGCCFFLLHLILSKVSFFVAKGFLGSFAGHCLPFSNFSGVWHHTFIFPHHGYPLVKHSHGQWPSRNSVSFPMNYARMATSWGAGTGAIPWPW